MKFSGVLLLLACASLPAPAQTTLGMINGRVYDRLTGAGIEGAKIEARDQQTGDVIHGTSAKNGYYTLLQLAPGLYWIRVTAGPPPVPQLYQPREAYELELFVAGRMQVDVPMRKSADTYSQQVYAGSYLPDTDAIVHTYTADLQTTVSQPLSPMMASSGTMVSTLSYVVDPRQVSDLPLSGRDIYTMLVTLPGVTADNATARGLGLSANGQRSYSANYLLDGVENNDRLLSGPLTVIAPEAIQEYRASTNNFSAEYGGSAGLVANAVTRPGTNSWHGIWYAYLNDTVLDANSFQHIAGLNTSTGVRTANALPRQPETDLHAGFWMGGPIVKNRVFASAAFEQFRARGSGDVFPFQVPVLSTIESCFGANRTSVKLLSQYRPPVPAGFAGGGNCNALSTTYNATIPVQFNRQLGLSRLDYVVGNHRLLARVAVSRLDQPDFAYSIYPGFSSSLDVNSTGVSLADVWMPRATVNNEFRVGYRNASQGWDRPHPDVPVLSISTAQDNGTFYPSGISLPGSPTQSSFLYRDNSGELSNVLTLALGRQVLSVGGGLLLTRSTTRLAFLSDGLYSFSDLRKFALDAPDYLQVTVPRQGPRALPAFGMTPNYQRGSAENQFYGFVQDSIKLTRDLGVNLGVRYESFGAPRNTGASDGFFQPGPGSTIDARVATGSMVYPTAANSLYQPDRNNWSGRFGIYYDLLGQGHTIFRGAYGIFYDRPFDLLTLGAIDNNIALATIYSVSGVYPGITRAPQGGAALGGSVPALLWIDRNLRTPYVQSWFGGVQQHFSKDLYFEAQAQGSLGRHLISTDIVNRRAADSGGSATLGRLNASLPEDIFYRSNGASSTYTALTALTRYRTRNSQTQVAYTWGHSIDNQSDPLQGTFDDLQLSRASNNSGGDNRAGFTRQFQSGADRASSDFDQRQNLVLYSIWHVVLPGRNRIARAAFADWQVAGIAGFRSGFPFNVISTSLLPACPGSNLSSYTEILRNRPNLVPGKNPFLAQRVAVPGGYQLLDPSAFCDPGVNAVGDLGRNALTGPGFWNVDLSLANRSVRNSWANPEPFNSAPIFLTRSITPTSATQTVLR